MAEAIDSHNGEEPLCSTEARQGVIVRLMSISYQAQAKPRRSTQLADFSAFGLSARDGAGACVRSTAQWAARRNHERGSMAETALIVCWTTGRRHRHVRLRSAALSGIDVLLIGLGRFDDPSITSISWLRFDSPAGWRSGL